MMGDRLEGLEASRRLTMPATEWASWTQARIRSSASCLSLWMALCLLGKKLFLGLYRRLMMGCVAIVITRIAMKITVNALSSNSCTKVK